MLSFLYRGVTGGCPPVEFGGSSPSLKNLAVNSRITTITIEKTIMIAKTMNANMMKASIENSPTLM
jgi:hypothetical protein